MKDDLISRQELRNAMYHEAFETDTEMQKWDSGCWIRYKLFEETLDKLPSAQKKGKWILTEDDSYEYCTCSECGYQNGENWMNGSDIPFCADCGADMRGEQE